MAILTWFFYVALEYLKMRSLYNFITSDIDDSLIYDGSDGNSIF